MTQGEIQRRLHELRYKGRWSYSALAKQSGLSRPTIARALEGNMSEATQIRLVQVIKVLPQYAPIAQKKRRPGLRKRRFIRFNNLRRWLYQVEVRTGCKRFKTPSPRVSIADCGYVCCKLDYMLKSYLLELFGAELAKKKIVLGDCYSVEQWILKIKKELPNMHQDLLHHLSVRK